MDPIELLRQISVFVLLTLLISALPLIVAAVYAARPTESKLALMRPFSLATLFASTAGTLSGLGHTLRGIAATDDMTGRWSNVAAGGSEAVVPMIFGLTCLTVAWVLVAVGMWRGMRQA